MNYTNIIIIVISLITIFNIYYLYRKKCKENDKLWGSLNKAHSTNHELRERLEIVGKVTPNTLWQHSNGAVYEVTGYANLQSKDLIRYPINIIYKNSNNDVWCRPLSDWHRSFTPYNP